MCGHKRIATDIVYSLKQEWKSQTYLSANMNNTDSHALQIFSAALCNSLKFGGLFCKEIIAQLLSLPEYLTLPATTFTAKRNGFYFQNHIVR